MTPAELFDRYERGGDLLAYATSNLSDASRDKPIGPGSWSIIQLVTHLADSDLVGADRIKRVIAEDDPTLLAYDENAWISRLNPQVIPLEEAVELFRIQRRYLARVLRSLDESDYARAGQHSERGRMTLIDLVVGYVGHLDHHLRFLYAKRGALGSFIAPHYSFD